jgi:hypothetical protein
MPGMRNISKLGGNMVSVLWIQSQNKTPRAKIQRKIKNFGPEYTEQRFFQ